MASAGSVQSVTSSDHNISDPETEECVATHDEVLDLLVSTERSIDVRACDRSIVDKQNLPFKNMPVPSNRLQNFVEEQALDEFVRQYSSCYSFSNDVRFEQLLRKLLLDRLSNWYPRAHARFTCIHVAFSNACILY